LLLGKGAAAAAVQGLLCSSCQCWLLWPLLPVQLARTKNDDIVQCKARDATGCVTQLPKAAADGQINGDLTQWRHYAG
jgi:hypothetical protein